jgi:hypothetical protein
MLCHRRASGRRGEDQADEGGKRHPCKGKGHGKDRHEEWLQARAWAEHDHIVAPAASIKPAIVDETSPAAGMPRRDATARYPVEGDLQGSVVSGQPEWFVGAGFVLWVSQAGSSAGIPARLAHRVAVVAVMEDVEQHRLGGDCRCVP